MKEEKSNYHNKYHNEVKKLSEYLNDFLDWVDVEKGLSSKTQENYARFLKKFFDWLKLNNLENIKPNELSPDQIFKYKVFLSRKADKSLKRSTQNYYLIALRQFLVFWQKKTFLPCHRKK